jgi:ABC-type transport system involved in cytochrome c biogenesis permease subunit
VAVLFPQADIETGWFAVGVCIYLIASLLAWTSLLRTPTSPRVLLTSIVLGVAAFAISIGLRWYNHGHGPFVTLYEVLVSNLFSLGLIFALAYGLSGDTRPAARVVLPLLGVIGVWAWRSDMTPVALPATYATPLLWLHVGVGKVFLGFCTIAVGLAGVLLMRRSGVSDGAAREPDSVRLDELAWRYMAVAFVFQSLMLIAGAAWAQDAWGRFWAWDSLETWAFITWLVLGLGLHTRLTWKLPVWFGWLMIFAVFALAMLTFFGVPFSSMGPHRGII